MAWLYFGIVALDFVIFPIIWLQMGKPEYKPITLQGGGLFHVAMGAIVATASIGRSWEKMAQYRMDSFSTHSYSAGGYDPYAHMNQPYPGSPPVQAPYDNELQNQEDEIIPPSPGTK